MPTRNLNWQRLFRGNLTILTPSMATSTYRVVTHLFAFPVLPPSLMNSMSSFHTGYALHRTRLHPSLIFAVLGLKRLKACFPTAQGSSGCCLFGSTFMLASKVICDNAFKQIVVDRRIGYVPAEGDQPDGERDVPVFGLGADRPSSNAEGIRGDGE